MWALAHDHVERDKCQGCGHPMSVTTDPANEGAHKGHAVRCDACKAIAHAAEAVDDKRGLLSYAEREDPT